MKVLEYDLKKQTTSSGHIYFDWSVKKMKTIITIVGVGERRYGVSKKSGKSYDFTPVAFTYEDPFFSPTGVKAETVNVDQSALGDYKPTEGDVVTVVMHNANYRTYIDAIL